jgi:glc operon protein GlcG
MKGRFSCFVQALRCRVSPQWARLRKTPPATGDIMQGMKTKHTLELSDVKKIAAAAEAEALRNQWAVSIAIVDDGGHLLWLQRLDGAAAISSYIGPAKARTAALGRRETKVYEDIINQGRTAFLSAPEIEGMLEGGVPILKDGQVIGAVGVSGVKSPEDAQIARAGIAALG